MLLMLVLHVIEICSKGFSSISNIIVVFFAFTLWFIYFIYLTIFLFANKPIPDWAPLHVLWSDTQMQFKSFPQSSINFCRKIFSYLRCWSLDSSWLKFVSVENSSPKFTNKNQNKNPKTQKQIKSLNKKKPKKLIMQFKCILFHF